MRCRDRGILERIDPAVIERFDSISQDISDGARGVHHTGYIWSDRHEGMGSAIYLYDVAGLDMLEVGFGTEQKSGKHFTKMV